MKLWFNLLCHDIEAQLRFYQALLGWPEALRSRSTIYRALELDGVQFGFNAQAAYGLLDIEARRPSGACATNAPTTAFATFMLGSAQDVDASTEKARTLGGAVIKPPYPTYYGQWQAVLADPERHVFRLSAIV